MRSPATRAASACSRTCAKRTLRSVTSAACAPTCSRQEAAVASERASECCSPSSSARTVSSSVREPDSAPVAASSERSISASSRSSESCRFSWRSISRCRTRQIFLGGDVRKLALMRFLARAVERGADLGDARAQRVVIGAELLVFLFEPLDLDREHVHLALLVEHGRGHFIARAAADHAAGVSHGAVERDRGDARVATHDGNRITRARSPARLRRSRREPGLRRLRRS